MSDLISRKALLEEIENGKGKPKIYDGMQEVSWINECIQNAPTAFDLENVIEQLKENEEDVIKAIEENSPSEFHMIKIKDLKELFEEYTQEQIDILKFAINATNGKNGG